METVCYGIGGYLPDHPNGNVIERVIDNGDGTGTRTIYHPDGDVAVVVELTGLPIIPPPTPDPTERIAELESQVDALLAIIEGA